MNTEETKDLRGVELLRAVKQHVLEEPTRLDMGSWIIREVWGLYRSVGLVFPACGTIACIAGWVCVLGGRGNEATMNTASAIACELLGLSGDKADKLFFISGWPEDLCSSYCSSFLQTNDGRVVDQSVKAQAAADAIDWFIANYMEGSHAIA